MNAVPEGFVHVEPEPGVHAVVSSELNAAIVGAGLLAPWSVLAPRPPGPGTGRGPRAVVRLGSGEALLVKAYRRGGVLARVNAERYFATNRFLDELVIGRRARERGIPVGEAIGVVLRAARPGWHAFGLARFIEGGHDLARLFAGMADRERAAGLWAVTMQAVRVAFDGGLEHADLNLGNVVVREPGNAASAFLVDLDRARWHEGGVPADARRRVLARLERSWTKVLGGGPLSIGDRRDIAHGAGVTP